MEENKVYQGRVKDYFSYKSYGFIKAGSTDYFFHIKSTLEEVITGDIVTFELGSYNGKTCAINVKKCKD
jgi:cold shock CspA family protein